MLYDLVLRNRSYRRFDESFEISRDTLVSLCEYARVSPSAANRQSLRFLLINSKDGCEKVFSNIAWAGYLKNGAPDTGERPTSYIIILNDNSVWNGHPFDVGIAAQSILLAASEKGLGGCMFASFKNEPLRQCFDIDENLEIKLVVAIGKTVEEVVIDEVKDGDIKYWRDEDRVHHVPKRPISEIVL